jgi:beta-lactamase regulating signal transducer with metallopeptidase domain
MPTRLLESAALSVFHATWQAGLLAIVIALVCRIVPRLPAAARSWMWIVVLIRFLIPIAPQSPASMFNLVKPPASRTAAIVGGHEPQPGGTAFARLEHRAGTDDLVPTSGATRTSLASPVSALDLTIGAESSAIQGARTSAGRWWLLAAVIWAAGVVILSGRALVSWIRLQRFLRTCRVVEEQWPIAVLEECRLESGIRRAIELLVTDSSVAPALAGAVFPRIVLSEGALKAVSPAELAWLFRHELAHVRRWDLAIQRLWSCARALHWFNPLVWWAASRVRIEAELACDESVVKRATGREQLAYGQALLKVAEILTDATALPAAVGLLVREPTLKRRVRAITGYRRRSLGEMFVAAVVLLCLAGAGLTDATEKEATGPETPVDQSSAPAPAQGEGRSTVVEKTGPRALELPAGPDGRPQLAAVLDAWDRGSGRLDSYDLYLTMELQGFLDQGKANWPLLPKPSVTRKLFHDVRAGVKMRIEDGVGEPGQKPTGSTSVWDGELAKIYNPSVKQLLIHDRPSYLPWDYAQLYSNFAASKMTQVLRARPHTVVERMDGAHVVVFTPTAMGHNWSPFGYRIWLDPKRNFLPTKIQRLLDVEGTVINDLEIDNTLEEISPGVWAPVTAVESFYPQTKESGTSARRLATRAVTSVNRKYSRFNVPFDGSVFKLDVPIDTTVYDQIVDANYQFGKAEKPLEQISQWAFEGKLTAKELKEFAKKSGITDRLKKQLHRPGPPAGKVRESVNPSAAKTPQTPPVAATSKPDLKTTIDPKELATTNGKIKIRVLASDGRPVVGAEVFANVVHPLAGRWAITNRTYTTDSAGQTIVELPRMVGITKIWASKPGYPDLFACWYPGHQSDASVIPGEFTFQPPKATLIGGSVNSVDGKPIQGVAGDIMSSNETEIVTIVEHRPYRMISLRRSRGPTSPWWPILRGVEQ